MKTKLSPHLCHNTSGSKKWSKFRTDILPIASLGTSKMMIKSTLPMSLATKPKEEATYQYNL